MARILRDDLSDFQIRERSFPFPNEIQIGFCAPTPMKARLTKLSLAQGVSEAQLVRYLVTKGLEHYGIDALKAK